MTMTINDNANAAKQLAEAMGSGDAAAIEAAFGASMDAIAKRIEGDYEAMRLTNDAAVLAQRGYRQLTAPEAKWYERLADAAHGTKQQFIDVFADGIDGDVMPSTILEDVFRHLEQEHPLLSRLSFHYVGYSGKWVIDDSSVEKGAWGRIDAKIEAEVEGALKVIDLTQSKYSAFCVIPLAIIDLGPSYMDAYVRAVLGEAIALGIEEAVTCGTGVNMPCGLDKNPNGSFDGSTGYPAKEAVKVQSFSPEDYGALVAELAVTEAGRPRKFGQVQLLCNMSDYLKKIMPATTVLAGDGRYANDLFPFPTEVIPVSSLPENKAILCLLGEYTLAAGSSKNGAIEYDDSVGFLDHTRAFRCVNYFAGRAYDATCSVVLDLSELDPAYITVKSVGAAASATQAAQPAEVPVA